MRRLSERALISCFKANAQIRLISIRMQGFISKKYENKNILTLMPVIVTLVAGADGSTSKYGNSAGVTTAIDRTEFLRDAEVLIASLLVEIQHELSLISALQFLSLFFLVPS
jgi:hypothetical protein